MPTVHDGQRAPGLRFGDPRTVAIFSALSQFSWAFDGFRNRDLRTAIEGFLSRTYGMRQMAYDLRRLLLKGLIERLAGTHRYRLTDLGRMLVLFCTKAHSRIFCAGISQLDDMHPSTHLNAMWRRFARATDAFIAARLAA